MHINLVLFDIRGNEALSRSFSKAEDVNEIIGENVDKLLWMVDGVGNKGTGEVLIGLGVVPEEVLADYGIEKVQMKEIGGSC